MQDEHRKLNAGLPWQKAIFNKMKALFTGKLDLSIKKKLVKCYTWRVALYDTVIWILGKVDRTYCDISEMRCWRRVEKISWTDRVKNKNVLRRGGERRT